MVNDYTLYRIHFRISTTTNFKLMSQYLNYINVRECVTLDYDCFNIYTFGSYRRFRNS